MSEIAVPDGSDDRQAPAPGRRRWRRRLAYGGAGLALVALFVLKDCAIFGPEVVAEANALPLLVVDGAHVFWFDGVDEQTQRSKLFRAPKEGGRRAWLATTAEDHSVEDIAGDDKHIYWTSSKLSYRGKFKSARVTRVPKAGGPGEVLVTDIDEPYHLVMDAEHLYWGTYKRSGGPDAIKRMPKAGGALEVVVRLPAGPCTLAVDDTHLYWTGSSIVQRMPKAGGQPQMLAKGQNSPSLLAIDDKYVYWGNVISHEVMKVPKAGGRPTPLALAQLNVRGLAVDGTHLYWTRKRFIGKGDVIVRLRKSGGLWPLTFVSGEDPCTTFVFSEGHLYWTTCPGYRPANVMRVSTWGFFGL